MNVVHTMRIYVAGLVLAGLWGERALAQAPAETPPADSGAAAGTESGLPPTQEDALVQVIDLNKLALSLYRTRKFDEARQRLDEAVTVGNENGLAEHSMMARTEIHLGIVALGGLGDEPAALVHFARARRLRSDIRLTPGFATKPLRKAFMASKNVDLEAIEAEAAAKEEAEALAADPPKLKMLNCPAPIEGPPGKDVGLGCEADPGLPPLEVLVYYRPSEGETYIKVPMKLTDKGWYNAVIPARHVKGRSLQFYFEALDNQKRLAAANGKNELPNVLVLKEGAPPVKAGRVVLARSGSSGAGSDEETPLELEERIRRETTVSPEEDRRAPGRVWVGIAGGSSYGWHRRLPLERHQGREVTQGFSPAGLGHFNPEIGIQLSRRWSLSLQSRHQYLPASGSGDADVVGSPPTMAHAFMLRAHVAFAELGDLQFVGTFAAGGGSALRMQVPPAPEAELRSSDTVVVGPVVFGPSLGLSYNFSRSIIALVEGRSLVGVWNLGALFEANAGLQLAF